MAWWHNKTGPVVRCHEKLDVIHAVFTQHKTCLVSMLCHYIYSIACSSVYYYIYCLRCQEEWFSPHHNLWLALQTFLWNKVPSKCPATVYSFTWPLLKLDIYTTAPNLGWCLCLKGTVLDYNPAHLLSNSTHFLCFVCVLKTLQCSYKVLAPGSVNVK